MTRKLFLASGCAVFFCAGWCFGQGQTATHLPGGSIWKSLSLTEHNAYVLGFLNGYGRGMMQGSSLVTEKGATEKVSAMTPAVKDDYERNLVWAHRVAPTLLGSPVGLEATVSTFYADYRNMPVCFDEAILFSAASLAGKAATEQELGAARKRGAEHGCN